MSTQIRPQQTYMAQQSMGRGGPSGLADVLEVLLDKGLVIDAFVRVSLVGIELLTIDARVVIASVDTYLRFAEAVNRLDLVSNSNAQSLSDIVGGGQKSSNGNGKPRALSGVSKSDDSGGDEKKLEPALRRDQGDDNRKDESKDEAPRDSSDHKDGDRSDSDDKSILSRIKERGQVF